MDTLIMTDEEAVKSMWGVVSHYNARNTFHNTTFDESYDYEQMLDKLRLIMGAQEYGEIVFIHNQSQLGKSILGLEKAEGDAKPFYEVNGRVFVLTVPRFLLHLHNGTLNLGGMGLYKYPTPDSLRGYLPECFNNGMVCRWGPEPVNSVEELYAQEDLDPMKIILDEQHPNHQILKTALDNEISKQYSGRNKL